ncbi:hypothetical protein ABBQ38_009276 [Trebouxia sp. C0009 RCD-2024]
MEVGVPAMLPAAVITEAQISAAIKASNETDFKNAIRAARDLVEPCPGIISAELLNVAAGNPDRRFLRALLFLLPSNGRECLRQKVICTVPHPLTRVLTTPLHTAARKGHYNNVLLLMEAGASNLLYEILDPGAPQQLHQYTRRQAGRVATDAQVYNQTVNAALFRRLRRRILAIQQVESWTTSDIAEMVHRLVQE